MKNNRYGFAPSLIVLVLSIFMAGVVVFYKLSQDGQYNQNKNATSVQSISDSKGYVFEIVHPELDWKIEKNKNEEILERVDGKLVSRLAKGKLYSLETMKPYDP